MQFILKAYDGEGVLEKVWEKIEIENINVVIANGIER